MMPRTLVRWLRISPQKELPFTMAVIILAVAIPTTGLLFFMNRAMNGEGDQLLVKLDQSRQTSLDQALIKVREALDARVVETIQSNEPTTDPAKRFQIIMQHQTADGCLILNSKGAILYPVLTQPTQEDERSTAEAKADLVIDDAVNDLTRSGQALTAQAMLKTVDSLGRGKLASAKEMSGRLLRIQAMLAAAQEVPVSHPRRAELLESLTKAVADDSLGMATGQRIHLAKSLVSMGQTIDWPWLEASEFSLKLAHSYAVPDTTGVLVPVASAPEIFAIRPANGASVLYLQKQALIKTLEDVASKTLSPQGLSAKLAPHGAWANATPLATRPLGLLLPGWEIAAFGPDATSTIAKQIQQMKWIYRVAAIGGCVLIAALAAWAIRRFAQRSRDNQVKHDFLSIVSHELKTPLTSIRMFVDSLADGGMEDPERAHTYLDFIRRENERLSRLVTNFLTFSKIESGRMDFDFHIVHPEDIGEAVTAAVSGRIEQPQIQFSYTAEKDLPLLKADLGAITTALVNLIDNAIKYSGNDKRILFTISRESDDVAFTVTDNGIGMSPETINRLGEKYFRDRNAGNDSRSGFGLGLHIVRSMVEAHGGKLDITSTLEVGSRFVVRLPAQSEINK
jgi:signal transduction histidine kinase